MRHLVSIVDDDESVRESLPDLLTEHGYAVRAFSSAGAFLASGCVGETSCLILDIAMPEMNGLELQLELARRGAATPIVFITARHDDAERSLVFARGALACLFKPFSESSLVEALDSAMRTGSVGRRSVPEAARPE